MHKLAKQEHLQLFVIRTLLNSCIDNSAISVTSMSSLHSPMNHCQNSYHRKGSAIKTIAKNILRTVGGAGLQDLPGSLGRACFAGRRQLLRFFLPFLVVTQVNTYEDNCGVGEGRKRRKTWLKNRIAVFAC